MRNWSVVVVAFLATALILAFAYFVWPTRYRYDTVTVDFGRGGLTTVVRTDRLSGRTQRLNPTYGHWEPSKAAPP